MSAPEKKKDGKKPASDAAAPATAAPAAAATGSSAGSASAAGAGDAAASQATTLGGVAKKRFMPNLNTKRKTDDQAGAAGAAGAAGSAGAAGAAGSAGTTTGAAAADRRDEKKRGSGDRGRGRGRGGSQGPGAGRGRGRDRDAQVIQGEGIFSHGLARSAVAAPRRARGTGAPRASSASSAAAGDVRAPRRAEAATVKTDYAESDDSDDVMQTDDTDGLSKVFGSLAAFADTDVQHRPMVLPMRDAVLFHSRLGAGDEYEGVKQEPDAPRETVMPRAFVQKGSDFLSQADSEGLMLLQLPTTLPFRVDPALVAKEAAKLPQDSEGPAPFVSTMKLLPEGSLGTLRVRRSGRMELVLGDNTLHVLQGTTCEFLQHVFAHDEAEKRLVDLGPVLYRFQVTPNVAQMLEKTTT
eukprot:m.60203 g.60203  ORF g.60203 m.60203 type:complete len:410 (+) comp13644_c0_seq2:52-1281(+)